MSDIDVRAYWEKRLGEDWSLRGVGFRRLGSRFNAWQYRLRAERFTEVIGQMQIDASDARVLDVGSGTGFYIDQWMRLGAENIVGLDLTDAAVDSLGKAFPNHSFVRNDISEGTEGLSAGSFDIVSCMDVTFHILENQRLTTAISNIASLLAPGGTFIWSDLFIHGREYVDRHTAWRSLYRVEALLDSAGLDIELRAPMLYFMNEPRDAPRLILPCWRAFMWFACRTEWSANFFGRLAYRLDRYMTRRRTESPSTEIMVCRKRST